MTNRELSEYYAELSRRYAELAKLEAIEEHMVAHGKEVTEQVSTKRAFTEARVAELLKVTIEDRTTEIAASGIING